jgi:hypothetical protein
MQKYINLKIPKQSIIKQSENQNKKHEPKGKSFHEESQELFIESE